MRSITIMSSNPTKATQFDLYKQCKCAVLFQDIWNDAGPTSVLQLTGGILAGMMLVSLMLVAFGVSFQRWKKSHQEGDWLDEETPEGDNNNFEPHQTISLMNNTK